MQTFNQWVTCFKPNPHAKLRLFCFPYAGGSAAIFRPWVDELPVDIEICPIELAGRGRRINEDPFTQLFPLIQAIAPALLPYLDKPFAFFGHSMGGVISFELTRLLRRDFRLNPCHLFVSGRRAPQIPDPAPPIHALPDHLFIEELRHLNGTPNQVLAHQELMQMFLPILKADFAVIETYIYSPERRLNCPITTFGGLQDPKTPLKTLRAWQDQTHASFSLKMLPGDHFFLHSAQSQLLQTLAECLEEGGN